MFLKLIALHSTCFDYLYNLLGWYNPLRCQQSITGLTTTNKDKTLHYIIKVKKYHYTAIRLWEDQFNINLWVCTHTFKAVSEYNVANKEIHTCSATKWKVSEKVKIYIMYETYLHILAFFHKRNGTMSVWAEKMGREIKFTDYVLTSLILLAQTLSCINSFLFSACRLCTD